MEEVESEGPRAWLNQMQKGEVYESGKTYMKKAARESSMSQRLSFASAGRKRTGTRKACYVWRELVSPQSELLGEAPSTICLL